jgi:Mg2+ and Co2+ transporter CorA
MKTLALLYDAAGHDRKVDDLEKVDPSSLGAEQLLWVDVSEFVDGQLHGLPPHLPVAEVSLEELGHLQIFDDHYRFAISLHDKERSKLGFVVGKTWLLTLSKVRPPFFEDFVEADQGQTLKGRMSPTALTATLLIRQMDAYRKEVALVDKAIDTLDETILRSREKRTPLGVLAALRRRVAGLRAGLGDQREVIHSLIGPDFFAHIAPADEPFLVETNRVFERVEDDVARARETIIGSFELYASRVAQDTNQLLKALTIATVITGIIGAAAGVFGMNFDTPIAHSGLTGFLWVTGAMIFAAAALLAVAVWRRWL